MVEVWVTDICSISYNIVLNKLFLVEGGDGIGVRGDCNLMYKLKYVC